MPKLPEAGPRPLDLRGTPTFTVTRRDDARRWLPAMVGAQPCLADAVLPDGTPDFGRGASVLFPNQEECLWTEHGGHQGRLAYAPAEPLPWDELHTLRDLRDVVVQELWLPNRDVVEETWVELARRERRSSEMEAESSTTALLVSDLRHALREAAASLRAAGDAVAAAKALEAAGPERATPSGILANPDERPF